MERLGNIPFATTHSNERKPNPHKADWAFYLVGAAGLEPARPKPEDFKFALPVRSTFEIRSDDLETTR